MADKNAPLTERGDDTDVDTSVAPPSLPLAAILTDAHAAIADARQRTPDVASSELGPYTISYQAAREILTDPAFAVGFVRMLTDFGITDGPFVDWMAASPLNHDGDYHRRYRALHAKTFTPRNVDALRPALARTAHDLIDAFGSADDAPNSEGDLNVDFVSAFAHQYPLLALCELIGVPPADRADFAEWADTIGLGFNPIEMVARISEVDAAVVALKTFTRGLLTERRATPHDDLVSRIAVQGNDFGFDDDALTGMIAGLVFAGHETTKMQLGWMISVLAEHPDVWLRVSADAGLAPRVIDEVMRYRSAVTGVGRVATVATEIAGCPFAAGDRAMVSLWGADDDPAAYPEAGFDIDADRAPHVAFGYGAHFCLGSGLAKAELQEALLALTARLGPPVLGDGAEWRPPLGICGPNVLPVRFAR